MKRLLDIAASGVGLLILSPLLLAIAALVRLDSTGPVFYRGVRVGLLGKPFRIFKFRTMVENAEMVGTASTPEDDPRVTRLGRVLRKYKLDELPQLLNVFGGQMSLVGPRPQVSWAVQRYTPDERALLTVRPGITDFASLHFREEAEILRGSADPDKDYFEKIHPEKMRLSLEYIRRQSLWLDFQILAKTVGVVIFRPAKSDVRMHERVLDRNNLTSLGKEHGHRTHKSNL
jgi:lipopolysaccharide/colanic/teichoic acid biosynthesis glycosyltransferase